MNVKKKEKDNKFRKKTIKFDKMGANRKVLSLTNHNTFENESLTASRPITGSQCTTTRQQKNAIRQEKQFNIKQFMAGTF